MTEGDVRTALRALFRGYLDYPEEGDVTSLCVTFRAFEHVKGVLDELSRDPDDPRCRTCGEQAHEGSCPSPPEPPDLYDRVRAIRWDRVPRDVRGPIAVLLRCYCRAHRDAGGRCFCGEHLAPPCPTRWELAPVEVQEIVVAAVVLFCRYDKDRGCFCGAHLTDVW